MYNIDQSLFDEFDQAYKKMLNNETEIIEENNEEPLPTLAVEEAITMAVGEKQAEAAKSTTDTTTKENSSDKNNDTPHNTRILQDFGNKIGGARKDAYATYQRSLETLDEQKVTTPSLAKNWPAPNYEKLLEQGLESWKVSAIRALRESIPSSGRNRYGWSELLRERRALAVDIIRGENGMTSATAFSDYCHAKMGQLEEGWADWSNRWHSTLNQFKLYEAIGHKNCLVDYAVTHKYDCCSSVALGYSVCIHAPRSELRYGQVDGVTSWIMTYKQKSKGHGVLATELTSFDDVINFIKEDSVKRYTAEAEKAASRRTGRKNPYFVNGYIRNSETTYSIARTSGNRTITVKNLPDCKSMTAAQTYIECNKAELDKLWKELTTVPNERNETNRERSGVKRINGDITPEKFMETFGFYGVEFGNWVNGTQRQEFLNETYNALLDLADAINVPPKALSLNGNLSMRFGSNGRGGKNAAAAHYEPTLKAINLTKKAGAGCLAHEWFHALDNYLGRIGHYDMATANTSYNPENRKEWRPELSKSLYELSSAIRGSKFHSRSLDLDYGKSKQYWASIVEESARAFETYVINKLADKNITNDFLANIQTEAKYTDTEKNPHKFPYPYPTQQEMEKIGKSYDNLFSAIKTRETEQGVEIYSCSDHESLAGQLEHCRIAPPNSLTKKELLFQKFSKEVMGVGLEFYDGPKTLHGKFDPRFETIYINRQSGADMEWVFYHELFHSMSKQNPELCSDLMRWTENSQIITQQQIEAYRKAINAHDLSDNQIRQEMFADALAEIKTGKKLVEIMEKEDKNLAARFVNFTKKMADRLTSFIKKEPEAERIGLTEKQLKSFAAHLEVAMPHNLSLSCLKNDFNSWQNRALLHVPFNGNKEEQKKFDIQTASAMLKDYPPALVEDTIIHKSPLGHINNYAKSVMKNAKSLDASYSR